VLGVPHDRFGEQVVALVQVTDNHYLDDAELKAWCRRKLAGYKTPRQFLFVDTLDRSASGKAPLEKLRAVAMERLGIPE
jgi:acyl-CoA synthetase (AMP-forming)/AMP-acid ligase II